MVTKDGALVESSGRNSWQPVATAGAKRARMGAVAMLVLVAFAAGCGSGRGVNAMERHAGAAAPVVPSAKARRIAAVWGSTLTFLPTWAPPGVAPRHWRSETCGCATDDSRLIVQFEHGQTRLDWEVSDQYEFDRVRSGIVCRGGTFAAHVIAGRTVFYRPDTDAAWICIPVPAGARWYPATGRPAITPGARLTISLRQIAGRTGRLRPADLRRMVATARRSAPPGRTSRSRYELPPQNEVRRMLVAFRRPLVLPTRLPGGFIYSDWALLAGTGIEGPRRELNVRFGGDSLFEQIAWHVSSEADSWGLDCLGKSKPRPQAVINGRRIYANEAMHSVEVWTCFAPRTTGNAKPLVVGLWYDIRLHSPKMLHLALRIIGAARLVRNR
jgi:hypothetical protein